MSVQHIALDSPQRAGANVTALDAAAAALDQSHDLIVVLDGDGTIVLTNAAWRAGADERGSSCAAAGCGVNYFDVCEQSDGAMVSAGIRAVLMGERPRFEFEYSCHSTAADSWYALEVVPLVEPGTGVVLTHTNITTRVIASRMHRHGRDVDPVTMLATSPAAVKGLARMLADAQSQGNSLAVVTITLSDLVDIESCHGRRSRDELVVQVVARVRRLTRADDVVIRVQTNQLVLFASVADAQGGTFLRGRISDVLEGSYLLGAARIECPVEVAVTSSDRFSSLDSLLCDLTSTPVPTRSSGSGASIGRDDADIQGADTSESVGQEVEEGDVAFVPLVVYSLPDGYLQAANEAARSLFGLRAIGPHRLHARRVADPIDLRHTTAALSTLSSGATDSYRAHRTLMTAEGPLALLTSVRRLVVGNGALAVVLTVPAQMDSGLEPVPDDPFSVALVAGSIDANGVIDSVSSPNSQMETTLVGALSESLLLAAHPDEADLVEKMLETMRTRGSAAGTFRVPHAEQGWVLCQCHLFTLQREQRPAASSDAPVVSVVSYAFVLSTSVSTTTMVDKIARLENHIRRIGSEVHAADLELTVRPAVDHGVSAALAAMVLTARQRDIVERLVMGQRVPSIAAALFISRSTVRNHLAQVYRLIGVHSQEELLNALRAT